MRGRGVAITAAMLVAMSLSACFVTGTSSSGIGFPAGPSLVQFGVVERCQRGGDCTERAMEAIEAALGRLGPELEDTPITTNDPMVPAPGDRLYIQVTSDPMFEWRAEMGTGSSADVMVDLTDENPYVVVAPGLALRLSDEDAAAIRDALFVAR
jgi:hypothetical protein